VGRLGRAGRDRRHRAERPALGRLSAERLAVRTDRAAAGADLAGRFTVGGPGAERRTFGAQRTGARCHAVGQPGAGDERDARMHSGAR
jgi:hypothetical protein